MSILKFDDISIETPYKLMSIIDIKLNHGVLIHSTLEIEAICEEESFDSFFKTTLNDSITLKKEDKIIFKGMIGSYDANKEGDVYSVYIKAVSATSLLDSKVESKSFQDTTMTYSSVIDEVIKDVRDSAVSFNVENKEIKEPLIMYNETAWEFVNRLASHFNTVLVADIKENKPRFYFGFKDKNIIEIEDSKFYKSSKDLKSLNLSTQKLIDTDFFSHEIKSKEVYELQDKVKFKHKTLYISHIKGEFIKSELIFTYKLSRINGIRQNKIYNENIKGVSLEGKVIDSKEEFVKLHLNIDKKQDAKKAHWFRVGAISNNVFYLMFEKNTYARLYFPSNKEVLAEVKNSVRKNGSTCPLTKKPENRYLTTKDKNQISLKPNSIEFKSNEGLDLSILMEDKKGTVFKSNSQINLNSKANISFNAKNKVNIKASEFVLIYNHDKIKPQSLTIENEFHFIGDKINLEGTDRTAFKMYNDDPKLIPIKERKPKKLLTNPMKAAALASAPNNLLACANSNQLAKAGGANGAKGGNTPAKTNASKAGAKSGSASNKFSGKFMLGAMLVAAAPIVGCVAGPAVMFGMIAMGCALMRSPKKSLPKPSAPKKLNLLASGKKDERYSSSMDEQTDEELWEEFLLLQYGLFSGAVKNGNLGRLKKEEILTELEKRLKDKTIEKENVFNYNMAKINAPKWREESLYTKFIEKNRELDFKLKLGMYSITKATNDMLQQAKEEKSLGENAIELFEYIEEERQKIAYESKIFCTNKEISDRKINILKLLYDGYNEDPLVKEMIEKMGESIINGEIKGINESYYTKEFPVNLIKGGKKYNPKKPTYEEGVYMAEFVYFKTEKEAKENELIGGWKFSNEKFMENSDKVGVYEEGSCRVAVFEKEVNGEKAYALASRGTQNFGLNFNVEFNVDELRPELIIDIPKESDIEDNVLQFFGKSEDAKNSMEFAKQFNEKHKDSEITFIGHSKGGGEAQINAVATNRDVITYNTATPNFKITGKRPDEYDGKIYSFVIKGDILNSIECGFTKPFVEDQKFILLESQNEILPVNKPINKPIFSMDIISTPIPRVEHIKINKENLKENINNAKSNIENLKINIGNAVKNHLLGSFKKDIENRHNKK